MTTGINFRRFPHRGRKSLALGVPAWVPLVEQAIAENEGFTITVFRVETELNSSDFAWGPFRLIDSKVAIQSPICSVSGDALIVEMWAKEPVRPSSIEVYITPSS